MLFESGALTGHHKLLAAVQRDDHGGWLLRIPNSTGKTPKVSWRAALTPIADSPRLFELSARNPTEAP